MKTAKINVRRIALDIVSEVAAGKRVFADSLDAHVAGLDIPPRDRALLYEISSGALRHKATLDKLIGKFSTRPVSSIREPVLSNLRLGAYQLVFLDRVPPHAAVNETVEIIRNLKPEASSFTNAVLRALSGAIDSKIYTSTPIGKPGTLIPIGRGWCRFNETVCPDQAADFKGFFEMCLSFPPDFADAIIAAFGKARAYQLGLALNEHAPLYLRINPLLIKRDDYLEQLSEAGVSAVKGGLESTVLVENGGPIASLPGYSAGFFTVQDETAQRIGPLFRVMPGESVLDLCAAPGGKTSHIAELNPSAKVVAVERDELRLSRLKENLKRLGLKNVECVLADARDSSAIPPGPYAAVLLDAPCSNTGVYRRKPDARWNFSKKSLAELSALQGELLSAAAKHVRPGGTLVYSTCSILPDENDKRVSAFLHENRDFELSGELATLPRSGGPDGGYFAALKKAGAERI